MKHLLVLLFVGPLGTVFAQDMPLSEIILPGETWMDFDGKFPLGTPSDYSIIAGSGKVAFKGKVLEVPLKQPTACIEALGGSTLLVADAGDRYVWAFQIAKDGTLGPGDRYCRMKVPGDDRRVKITPEAAYLAEPSAMTVDGARRTYVATRLGLQSFDPTGRLNGVFTAPPGRVTELVFDGHKLFAKVGSKVYVRKMLAEGKK